MITHIYFAHELNLQGLSNKIPVTLVKIAELTNVTPQDNSPSQPNRRRDQEVDSSISHACMDPMRCTMRNYNVCQTVEEQVWKGNH